MVLRRNSTSQRIHFSLLFEWQHAGQQHCEAMLNGLQLAGGNEEMVKGSQKAQ